MSYALYAMAAFIAFAAIMSVSMIGKERKPITPNTVIFTIVLSTIQIVILIAAAGRLS